MGSRAYEYKRKLVHRRPWSMMLLMLMMMSGDLAMEAAIHTEWTRLWIFHDSSAYALTYASLQKMTAPSLSIAKKHADNMNYTLL